MADKVEPTRVAIVGAGIVGLTLALALSTFDTNKDFDIDIYETTPELSEVGAGINMWPRTYETMKRVGLEEAALIPLFDHDPDLKPRIAFEMRKADQKNGFKIMDIMKDGGALRIHRADLQRTLLEHVSPSSNDSTSNSNNSKCRLHLSHRLTDYTINNHSSSSSSSPHPHEHHHPITLHFANSTKAHCDILVGADGIKSTIRQLFLPGLPQPEKYIKCIDPIWSGTVVYRGLVPRKTLEEVYASSGKKHRVLDHPGIMYIGKNKHTVIYPISGGKFINVVVAVHDKTKQGTVWEGPWSMESSQEELLKHHEGWDDELVEILKHMRNPTKWVLQMLNHLDSYAQGRVFLMGDAAHAMLPHQGAGAGVGIEDAFILATLLTSSQSSQLNELLNNNHIADIYNSICVPAAISRSLASTKQGHLVTLHAPGLEDYKEGDDIPLEKLVEVVEDLKTGWDWTTSDVDKDKDKAVELLRDRCLNLEKDESVKSRRAFTRNLGNTFRVI